MAIGGLLGVSVGLGFGCGSEDRVFESSGRYLPPAEYRVIVETVVEAPFDEVWDGLIERLSASSYRIFTFDKASRFLVVDLDRSTDAARSLNRPNRFADCGRMQRSFIADGRATEFDYGVAESSRHLEACAEKEAFEVRDVSRALDLSARATLYLQPEGPKRTRVTVNSRYTLTIETGATTRQVPREAAALEGKPRELEPIREEVRFTTFTRTAFEERTAGAEGSRGASSTQDTTQPRADGDRFCRATGELEAALIALSAKSG